MRLIVKRILDHLDHWKKALVGPLVTIVLLFYQQATGKPLTWGWFATLIVGGLTWQYFSEYQKIKKKMEADTPKIFLQYVERKGNRVANTYGFFVQVEGIKKAFDIRIVSPDTAGRDHMRLEMLWEVISGPVGNQPVHVPVMCSLRKGTSGQTMIGSQLDNYMRSKATEPKELVAVVTFKDVDGNECCARRFKVHRERNVTGNFTTFCDPY